MTGPVTTPPFVLLKSAGPLPDALSALAPPAGARGRGETGGEGGTAADARAATRPDIRLIPALDRISRQSLQAPTVLLLTDDLLADYAGHTDGESAAAHVAALPAALVVVSAGTASAGAAARAERLFFALEDATGVEAALRALRAAAGHSAAILGAERARAQVDRMKTQVEDLNRVGMALMSERDPERLLTLILMQARRLTTSDAGSLYLVEQAEDGTRQLRFRLAQNDSISNIPVPDFTLPIDRSSIAGYAASTGQPLLLDDAYAPPEGAPFTFNPGFDNEFGYRARSMLVVPMKDHHDRVVGVLQLINRKKGFDRAIRDEASAREHVLPYGETDVETVQSLAGQAAVSIENGQLYRNIENLFEGFIKAAVTAIDQRDPTTSGHSVRVATLTCDMASLIDGIDRGPFKTVRFSREQMQELRYAGLLHDFGKVGVREEVLVKSKKLPPVMLERIEARFDLIRRTLESSSYRRKLECLVGEAAADLPERTADLAGHASEAFRRVEEELERSLEQVDRFQQAVRDANEPRVLPEASAEILQEIAAARFPDFTGKAVPYLTGDELHFLSIAKGSLDPDERRQIESHVTFTYRFLREIPWTENLSGVADIAHGHHEKLDGSGYPKGVSGAAIPIQTRIMTVADIFDALTASDRPYKKALAESRALDILGMEAKAGQLDPAVVELLEESQVYRRILETDWRDF